MADIYYDGEPHRIRRLNIDANSLAIALTESVRSIFGALLRAQGKFLPPVATTAMLLLLATMGCRSPEAVAAGAPRILGTRTLPPPSLNGTPLKEALLNRTSSRSFLPQPLDSQTLSNLLWAANGINRPATGGRTAPSANDWRHIDIYLCEAGGVSRYDAQRHAIDRLDTADLRHLTGKQGFVDTAPLSLVLVSDERKMDAEEPKEMRSIFSGVGAGTIAQNVYLYCASANLGVVVRASLDREPLHKAMKLDPAQKIVVAQTIGWRPGSDSSTSSGAPPDTL